eukprot:UN00818
MMKKKIFILISLVKKMKKTLIKCTIFILMKVKMTKIIIIMKIMKMKTITMMKMKTIILMKMKTIIMMKMKKIIMMKMTVTIIIIMIIVMMLIMMTMTEHSKI